MKKSSFILNPNSERYRICKEPTCLMPFMTDHLRREFCCDKCKTEYNNRKIRQTAIAIRREKTNELVRQTQWMKSNKESINLLDALKITHDGLVFPAMHLQEAGLDLNAYNERIRTNDPLPSYHLVFGPYTLSLETPKEILIIKTKSHERKS